MNNINKIYCKVYVFEDESFVGVDEAFPVVELLRLSLEGRVTTTRKATMINLSKTGPFYTKRAA